MIYKEVEVLKEFMLAPSKAERRTVTTNKETAELDKVMYKWLLVMSDNRRDLNDNVTTCTIIISIRSCVTSTVYVY